MILNDLHGIISNPEVFKKKKMIGEGCGHEWIFIPKFCGNWSGPDGNDLKQEYQQYLFSCRKKTCTIVDAIRLYHTAIYVVQSIF